MSSTNDPTPNVGIDPSLHPAEQLAMLALVCASTSAVGDCESAIRTITRVRSYLDVLEAQFTARLRQMHTSGKAETAASVLAAASNTSTRDAQRKERRSEILDDADAFANGLLSGRISGEHVDALANACANLDDAMRAKVLDAQDELVNFAAHETPARLAKELRDLVRLHEHDEGVARDTQQRRDTFLNIKFEQSSGMYRVNGVLHPELGTSINTVINHHVRTMIRNDETLRNESRGRLQAEALGELVGRANSKSDSGTAVEGRPTAQINVLVDYETLTGQLHEYGVCETTDGAALPAWKVRQLACDNGILPIVMSGKSLPLDVGRTKRFFTPAQRAALRTIYPTCAMPGCDVGFERCEVHHLNPWEDTGLTDLDNGVPLCCHCHHLIHQPGWSTKLGCDRTFTVTSPTGRTLTGHPIPPGRSHRSSPGPNPDQSDVTNERIDVSTHAGAPHRGGTRPRNFTPGDPIRSPRRPTPPRDEVDDDSAIPSNPARRSMMARSAHRDQPTPNRPSPSDADGEPSRLRLRFQPPSSGASDHRIHTVE